LDLTYITPTVIAMSFPGAGETLIIIYFEMFGNDLLLDVPLFYSDLLYLLLSYFILFYFTLFYFIFILFFSKNKELKLLGEII
jgi:hypothetical protein